MTCCLWLICDSHWNNLTMIYFNISLDLFLYSCTGKLKSNLQCLGMLFSNKTHFYKQLSIPVSFLWDSFHYTEELTDLQKLERWKKTSMHCSPEASLSPVSLEIAHAHGSAWFLILIFFPFCGNSIMLVIKTNNTEQIYSRLHSGKTEHIDFNSLPQEFFPQHPPKLLFTPLASPLHKYFSDN